MAQIGACEETADLFERGHRTVQGNTHQAGYDVVQSDQFGGAVASFQPQKDFCWSFVVMDADVEGSLAVNADLLCGMLAAVGEGKACTHAATTSRSIVKLSGRSVVCWVPLGTPFPSFISSYRLAVSVFSFR